MNVTRLRYFVTVADELHFGRAAQRLHMSQPPLSQQIRQLEDELGVKLFDRTTRRVALTDAGHILYPQARHVLAAVDEVDATMSTYRRGESGSLRLGFVDSASYDVLPRFLQAYRAQLPAVQYELHTLSSDQQHRALLDRSIDVGIARVGRPGSAIAATEFLEERLWLAVPADHPLAARRTVTLARAGREPFVGFDRSVSPSLFRDLSALFAARDIEYDPVIEATEYTTVLGLVTAGQGLAVVPAGVRSLQPPGLRYIRLRDSDARSSLMLLHRDREPSPLVHRASQLVEALFSGR